MIDFEYDDKEYYQQLNKSQATELASKIFELTDEESEIEDLLYHLLLCTMTVKWWCC